MPKRLKPEIRGAETGSLTFFSGIGILQWVPKRAELSQGIFGAEMGGYHRRYYKVTVENIFGFA